MNTTADHAFQDKCPATGAGIDCVTGARTALPKMRRVAPGQTVILFDPDARA